VDGRVSPPAEIEDLVLITLDGRHVMTLRRLTR
jgi:hypothetical protein